MWAGRLSLGLTTSRGASYSSPTCFADLISYVSELCNFCCAVAKRPPPGIVSLSRSYTLVELITVLRQKWTPGPPWLIERSAIVIYLLILAIQPRSESDIDNYVNALEHRIAAQCLDSKSSATPLLWCLITNFETLELESVDRVRMLTRILCVMDKLSPEVRARLEAFFDDRLRLSGEPHIVQSEMNEDGDKENMAREEALELAGIQSAIWADVHGYIDGMVSH